MTSARTCVVVVDDHALFAEALVLALRLDGFTAHRLVPRATSTSAALQDDLVAMSADIVLLDLDLGPAGSGMELVSSVAASGAKVVVVSGHLPPARAGEAMSLGAQRAVSKTAPLDEIVQIIRRLSSGLPVASREETQVWLAAWRAEAREQHELQGRLGRLTARESEILGELMAGRQVREIALSRFVSEATVRTHVKAVLAKLQVSSQLAAVGLAHRAGWRPSPVDAGGRSRGRSRNKTRHAS